MDVERIVLECNSFNEFNEMQLMALRKGLLEKSMIVSSPTASGKTILAELTALNSILNAKAKVVYTCPLKALASEHFTDFKKKYSKNLRIKAVISTGDFDSSSNHLSKFDLIFSTYEKVESLIRHKSSWLSSIGLLIVDEIHEIDSDRGPTLEMLVTKLRLLNPSMKVLGLSATIPNARELSEWLDATLIESSYRPIPLSEGVYFNQEIKFEKNFELVEREGDSLNELILNTLKKEKQALVFCNSRKRAETVARKISHLIKKQLNEKQLIELKNDSEKVLSVLEQSTEQCKNLSSLIESGVAFHHAGLMQEQRSIIEELFKQGKLLALTSTPTLAAGVNIPANTVIIPSIYRYGRFGMEPISVREFKQMSGRAGRPKYDVEGRTILIAKTEVELEELMHSYVNGKIEEITSKLSIEPILRTHLLSLIASNFVFDLNSLEQFFSKTFYAKQFKDLAHLFYKLNDVLKELIEMNFVQTTEKGFNATLLGQRVAELYLDPITAFNFIQALKNNRIGKELSYLMLLSDSFELHPFSSIPKAREGVLWAELTEAKKELFFDLDRKMFEDNSVLDKYFFSQILMQWLEEVSEENLLKEFKIQPGILRSKLEIIDWLLYAAIELEKILQRSTHFKPLTDLRLRLKYGIKSELLSLVQLKNIGRVRARLLFKNHLRTINDLKKTDLNNLSRILGPKIALNVKHQLGQEKELNEKEIQVKQVEGQSTLDGF